MRAKKREPIEAILMSVQDGLLEKTFTVNLYPINKIANAVTHESRKSMEGYEELSKSLEAEGMRDPIILIQNTKENWERSKVGVIEEYINDYDENKEYLALTGNSRLTWAVDKGKGMIDAVLVPNFYWMHSVQLQLQNGEINHET